MNKFEQGYISELRVFFVFYVPQPGAVYSFGLPNRKG